jgi:hypothetical protein
MDPQLYCQLRRICGQMKSEISTEARKHGKIYFLSVFPCFRGKPRYFNGTRGFRMA